MRKVMGRAGALSLHLTLGDFSTSSGSRELKGCPKTRQQSKWTTRRSSYLGTLLRSKFGAKRIANKVRAVAEHPARLHYHTLPAPAMQREYLVKAKGVLSCLKTLFSCSLMEIFRRLKSIDWQPSLNRRTSIPLVSLESNTGGSPTLMWSLVLVAKSLHHFIMWC